MPDSPQRLPGNDRHLARLINQKSKRDRVLEGRLRRQLNAMVITAVLDRVRDENEEPIFLLKGGVAMELRLKLRARATSDYDAAFRARSDEIFDLIDVAIQEPWNGFEITRGIPEKIKDTPFRRVVMRLTYKGRSWGTVKVELAPVEGNMGDEADLIEANGLEGLQVPIPERVRCLSLRYQVAQKIHACTEVFEEPPENDRFRDIMDLLLLEDLIRDTGLSRVRDACIDIFERRRKHSWPPSVTVYKSWPEPYRVLSNENGFRPSDIHEAARKVRGLINEIEAAV